jgi:NADH-quinone oxidoreductase subunit M
MDGLPILSAMILVPLVAAAALLLLPRDGRGDDAARQIALAVTLALLAASLWLWARFESAGPAFQFTEDLGLFEPYFRWSLGIDGIALMLIVLTCFLMPVSILASWGVSKRVPEYMAAFLFLHSLLIGVFAATDIFLFYIFFEGGLIPMFLIIGIWGGARRIYASYKFFLYTLLGSVLMLLAMLWMVDHAGTTSIPALLEHDFPKQAQTWLWLAFLASFAVKMPMWPVHTWLPDAHVEAPTAGSVILAGILLKLGGYGFVRFSLPMFPDASVALVWIIWGLSMVAMVYTSLVALAQTDMKKLIAYSSVAHMAFVTAGLFAFNTQGVEGGLMVMLSHGLVSGALFLCVGVVYDRLHTRDIDRYGGVVRVMPGFALLFMLFTMASIGLPGTSGFVSEFLALMGTFKANGWLAVVLTSGVILGAAYMLWLYRRVVFGPLEKADVAAMTDLRPREWVTLGACALAVLWMGIAPNHFLEPMRAPAQRVLARLEAAGPPKVEPIRSAQAATAGAAKPAAKAEGAH